MATIQTIPRSPWRAIIETALYANSVRRTDMSELYGLALKQPEVICTDHAMYNPSQFGLPADAKVLVSNDGSVVGRTARARLLEVRNFDKEREEREDTAYPPRGRLPAQQAPQPAPGGHRRHVAGLYGQGAPDKPGVGREEHARLGHQLRAVHEAVERHTRKVQGDKKRAGHSGLRRPDWTHPEYPNGCIIIDEMTNCIAILGLRYFGERKKGTLTLAWTMGVRHNMVACHGGIKKIGNNRPIAVFGLSGSGKSSITNWLTHQGTLNKDEKVTVIHDDAFLIDLESDVTVALEPSLFDKTDAKSKGRQDAEVLLLGPEHRGHHQPHDNKYKEGDG